MTEVHSLATDVDQLLSPERLSDLSGHTVTDVALTPITPPFAKSGSALLQVTTNAGTGPRFVLKRVNVHRDWLMRATEDLRCRSVTLWQYGLLDRLPDSIDHGVLACARDGEGYALLMSDFGGRLMSNTPFSTEWNHRFLFAMAGMHAAFLEGENDPSAGEPPQSRERTPGGQPFLAAPELGLCELRHVYQMFSPTVGEREAGGVDEVPQRILEGWRAVRAVVPPDVVRIVEPLVADPTPLCRALARYPQTLVHGDYRHSNLGCGADEESVILLDWQLATRATPSVELGRYLGANSALLPGAKEESLRYYAAALQRHLGSDAELWWWPDQLALGLLGGFVQDGWAIVLKATTWDVGAEAREHWKADLAWWCDRVRDGARLL